MKAFICAVLLTMAVCLGLALAQTPTGTNSFAPAPSSPGYPTGRFYPGTPLPAITTVAVATTDTVVYTLPFIVKDYPIVATSLNTRTITGVASCAIKLVLWNNNPATHRPAGPAIAGSNTGQACSSTGSTQTVAISITLAPGIYWTGAAVTTGASMFNSVAGSNYGLASIIGFSAMTSSTGVTGLSAPYTYASDITQLDLTSATFTDVSGNSGVPMVYVGD